MVAAVGDTVGVVAAMVIMTVAMVATEACPDDDPSPNTEYADACVVVRRWWWWWRPHVWARCWVE